VVRLLNVAASMIFLAQLEPRLKPIVEQFTGDNGVQFLAFPLRLAFEDFPQALQLLRKSLISSDASGIAYARFSTIGCELSLQKNRAVSHPEQ
jgi:hypothetical protein